MSFPRRADFGLGSVGLAALLLVGLSLFVSAIAGYAKSEAPPTRSEEASEGYVGSHACSQCHQDIYRRFSQTSMGRSMSLVTPDFLRNTPTRATYFDQGHNRHFEVFPLAGRLYQSESGIDADGKESFRVTHQVEWIIGANVNGMGGIIRQGDSLFQAPLSFYSKPEKWSLSPGYEFADYAFSRPILAGCLFCHSGGPRPLPGTNGRFEASPFSEMSIGCENCHGPGAAHIQGMMLTTKRHDATTTLIVNPARLDPYLADNICMACHQTGDVRVLKPGKRYQDFRPGAPLSDTLAILMVPPNPESPPQVDHVEHYYSMTLSKCYRASSGRLNCISCHDPHVQPSAQEAPAYFARKCLGCHTNKSCKLTLEARRRTHPPDDCIRCHMPKRDIGAISHSSATNHRITARPDEPLPDVTFKQTTTALPDLIYVNPTPGARGDPPPNLTMLEAYGELSVTRSEYITPYLHILDQLERTQPENPVVQAALGRRDLLSEHYQQAVDHLQCALRTGPAQATTYADLSQALVKINRPEDALDQLEKAVALDLFNPVFQKTLVLQYINLKRYADARAEVERYVKEFPQDDFMRQMEANITKASATR